MKGRVINRDNDDVLAGASVTVSGTRRGDACNDGGFFAVRVPEGTYDVQASMIGFDSEKREVVRVPAGETVYLTFRLTPKVIELPAVRVFSNRSVPRHMEVEPRVLTARRSRILEVPTVGEPDLFRAMQALPGVSAPNDYSNELYIRGSGSDQNLILLDGAVVYNPYHLFGFAGAFNPDIIDQVNLSLGGFSARYGDRLSAVVDVRTSSVASDKLTGFGNFSLMSSKMTLLGRLNPKTHLVFSARRSYHDLFAGLLSGGFPYYFYDLYGKLTFQASSKSRFFVSGFFSRDLLLVEDEKRRPDVNDYDFYPDESLIPEGTGYTDTSRDDLIWDNLVFTTHWIYLPHPAVEIDFQVSQSSNPTEIGSVGEVEPGPNASQETLNYVEEKRQRLKAGNDFDTDNSVRDRTVRGDFLFTGLPNHQLGFGGGFSDIRLNYFWYGWDNLGDNDGVWSIFFDRAPGNFNYERHLNKQFFYAEDRWRFANALDIRPGLRFEKRSFVKDWTIEPRFNLRYQPNDDIALKFAYGRFTQGLATALEERYIQALPLIFPTEEGAGIERADHFIAGLDVERTNWQFSSDIYYKKLDNIIRATNSPAEFEQGSGKAFGLELGIKKNGDRLSFEANYALSYAKRRYGNVEYFTSFDQRHSLSSTGQYNLGKNWMLSFRWVLATGRRFSPTTIFYDRKYLDLASGEWRSADYVGEEENGTLISYAQWRSLSVGNDDLPRNRARYPVYHRLDLSFVKRIQKNGWAILPYLQIINTYFRWNVFYYYEERNSDNVSNLEAIPMMPFLPTFGVSIEF
jgi:hypothetical protein